MQGHVGNSSVTFLIYFLSLGGMKLIFVGPPGSGKGTVSKGLIEEFKFAYLSTGDMFREAITNQTEVGKEVKKILDEGGLVPDELTIKLVLDKVKEMDHYILDGYPRTIPQADAIHGEGIDLVIYFKIDQDAVIERLGGRRLDPETGKFYHLKYVPPPDEVKDRLIQRDDDKPEVITKRFVEYNTKTAPLIEYYGKKGILVTVDALPPPDEVYEVVKKIIEEKG